MPEVGVILGSKSDLPQMPAGIPVATTADAKNVVRSAAPILGIVDSAAAARHHEKRRALAG